MSIHHPVIAVTGSSGAGTTTVKRAFEHIFYREGITPAIIDDPPPAALPGNPRQNVRDLISRFRGHLVADNVPSLAASM